MYGGGSASKLTAGALAGILAAGMVPAAAFAEDEAVEPVDEAAIEEVAEEAAIELQASDVEAFALGTITAATDQDGAVLDLGTAIEYYADGEVAHYPIPTTLKTDAKEIALPTAEKAATVLGKDGTTELNIALAIVQDTNKNGVYDAGTDQAPASGIALTAVDGKLKAAATLATDTAALKSTPGKYLAVAYAVDSSDSDAVHVAAGIPFEVKSNPLDAARLFEIDGDAADGGVSDETFTWNNTNLLTSIGVKIDGAAIDAADYALSVYAANADLTGTGLSKLTDAGSYVAKIVGDNSSKYAGVTKYINFTVGALDLSKADIKMADLTPTDITNAGTLSDAAAIATIDGEDAKWGEDDGATPTPNPIGADRYIAISSVVDKDGIAGYTEPGEYTATLAAIPAAAGQPTNVTGTATAKFTVTGEVVVPADFQYGTTALAADQQWTVNSKATTETGTILKAFDFSKLSLVATLASSTTVAEADQAKLTFTVVDDADGKEYTGDAAKSQLAVPGNYHLTVAVDSASLSTPYSLGGSVTVKVKVVTDQLTDANVLATFDGKNLASKATVVYDGKDQLGKLTVKVLDKDKKELAAGTDYTVTYTDKATGKEITEAVNVGSYYATVKSAAYGLAGTQFEIEITAAPLTTVRIPSTQVNKVDGAIVEYLPYTGSTITPAIEYRTSDADGYVKKAGAYVYAELPADAYKLTYQYSKTKNGTYSAVSEIKDEGFYKVSIITSNSASSKNYDFAGLKWIGYTATDKAAEDKTIAKGEAANPFLIEVGSYRLFEDVKAGAWYEDVVYAADKLGYMNGYKGTNLFKPNNNLTRAEAATVICKMAGVYQGIAEDVDGSELGGSVMTGFSDIKGTEWFAAPVKWAADAGIVKGYTTGAKAGKFMPNDPVTREEFMVMIARYAKEVAGKDTASDGKAMAEKKDPQKVSSWAKDAVAWGVDGDMIGSNGTINPQGKITRAEVAKITTVYQPAPLTTVEVSDGAEPEPAPEPAVTTYTVSEGVLTDATVTISKTTAEEGETVKVVAVQDDATKGVTVEVKNAEDKVIARATAAAGNSATLEFDMPAGNVTIDAKQAS